MSSRNIDLNIYADDLGSSNTDCIFKYQNISTLLNSIRSKAENEGGSGLRPPYTQGSAGYSLAITRFSLPLSNVPIFQWKTSDFITLLRYKDGFFHDQTYTGKAHDFYSIDEMINFVNRIISQQYKSLLHVIFPNYKKSHQDRVILNQSNGYTAVFPLHLDNAHDRIADSTLRIKVTSSGFHGSIYLHVTNQSSNTHSKVVIATNVTLTHNKNYYFNDDFASQIYTSKDEIVLQDTYYHPIEYLYNLSDVTTYDRTDQPINFNLIMEPEEPALYPEVDVDFTLTIQSCPETFSNERMYYTFNKTTGYLTFKGFEKHITSGVKISMSKNLMKIFQLFTDDQGLVTSEFINFPSYIFSDLQNEAVSIVAENPRLINMVQWNKIEIDTFNVPMIKDENNSGFTNNAITNFIINKSINMLSELDSIDFNVENLWRSYEIIPGNWNNLEFYAYMVYTNGTKKLITLSSGDVANLYLHFKSST